MQDAIRAINKNPNLSAAEKSEQINQLFVNQRQSFASTASAAATQKQAKPCKHYMRSCDIQTPCCNKFYPCRICHDAAEEETHTLVRSSTLQMRCRLCSTVQPVSRQCVNPQCSFTSTHYFCLPCRLWSDDVNKPIFHCEKCGICRVGREEDHWHCDKCCLCYPNLMSNQDHHCLPGAAEESCPVCSEYMHTSTKTVSLLPCGHVMHSHCLTQLHRKQISTCPKCRKSLVRDDVFESSLRAEIDRTPMPDEYKDHKCEILCNDCEDKGQIVPFHFYGLQCAKCKSFNTSILNNIRGE